MLKIVLPKGSLEKATMALFESADLAVHRSSSVQYSATINDPRVDDVRILRPQEIPIYVAEGMFDVGITGRDWIEETSSDVVSMGELKYSKVTAKPVRIVVAVKEDSPIESVSDLPNGVRVSTEYPNLTKRYFADQGVDADIRLSYGATEAKVPDIVDVAVDITETGRALRAAGLRIVDTILTSYTEFVVNPEAYENEEKRHALEQILTLLQGTLTARTQVLVKLNVADAVTRDKVIGQLPSMMSPTVNELYNGAGFAIETVVAKNEINILIPNLKDAGATDIIELPLSKIIE